MIELKTPKAFGKGHTVTMFETIDELPIERFSLFNKYLLISGELGSDFEDIDSKHLLTMTALLDNPKKLRQQLINLRELIFNIVQGVNYNHLAFAVLIAKIDDKEVTDFSETNLRAILKQLSEWGVTNGDVKKKLMKQEVLSFQN